MSRSHADTLLAIGLTTLAVSTGAIVLFILFFVAGEALPAFRQIGWLTLLTDTDWQPTAGERAEYGIAPMLASSLLVTVGAILLATPLGLLAALFECYYAPRPLAIVYRRMVELLGGIPSVVFGYWGLVVLVPLINRWQSPGQSLLAGMLVLALMILPTIALTSSSALHAVPADYFRWATALGMGRCVVIWHLAIPTAMRGILAGVVLAAARAVGETMAVLMVCGNVVQVPGSLFDPIRTITANIALEMGYATSAHRSVLFATGLMLMLVVALGITLVELLGRRERHV